MSSLLSVFLSRPTSISSHDEAVCDHLEQVLQTIGLRAVTVGVNTFGNKAPLLQVREAMLECDGAIILGLRQLTIVEGISRPGTQHELSIQDVGSPSPWNHLEAGMAYGLELPMLIVKGDVRAEGVFDAAAGDSFIHEIPAGSDWMASPQLRGSLADWAESVRSHASSRPVSI